MTKKEKALKSVYDWKMWTNPGNTKFSDVIDAIIDALPDEPPLTNWEQACKNMFPIQHWRCPDGVTYPCHPGGFVPEGAVLVSGPEPVAEKASEPTSALMTEAQAREWKHWAGVKVRQTDSGYFEPSVEEGLTYQTELIALNKFRQMLATKARFGSAKEYNEAHDAILGQRSDPPATSGATQPPIWTNQQIDCEKYMTDEDARKLRIMKAMEEKPGRAFKFADGCWWIRQAGGDISWENWEPLFPEEPLWEGEIEVDDMKRPWNPVGNDYPGWRKIKVREVR